MPKVVIIAENNQVVQFPVSDQADAVRKVSSRLLKEFGRDYVKRSMDVWLKSGMKQGIRLGQENNRFSIQYLEEG